MPGPVRPAGGGAGRLQWSAAAGIPVSAVPVTAIDAEPAKFRFDGQSGLRIGRAML